MVKGRKKWNLQLISMFMCRAFIAWWYNWPYYPLSENSMPCWSGMLSGNGLAEEPWLEQTDGGAGVRWWLLGLPNWQVQAAVPIRVPALLAVSAEMPRPVALRPPGLGTVCTANPSGNVLWNFGILYELLRHVDIHVVGPCVKKP